MGKLDYRLGRFDLLDRRRDPISGQMMLSDMFTNAADVKAASEKPIATLVGYLHLRVEDHHNRLKKIAARAHKAFNNVRDDGLGFQSKAAIAGYIDVHPDSHHVSFEAEDVHAFMASAASKAEKLGPYQGFSQDPEKRAAEIARLEKYFPGLFTAGHVPTITFGDHDFGVS